MGKLTAATSVAVVISLLLVGCGTSRPPASVSVPGHQLTIAAARQVSGTWLADVDNLELHYSPAAAAQLMTGEALQSTVPVNGSSDLPAFVDSASQTPGNLPVYALALTGGGAAVIFTTINTVNYLATRTAAITSDFDLGSGVPEPPWFQHDFTVPAGTRMSQVTTFVLVATDPVRAKGHVEVIAADQEQATFSPGTEYAATHGL